MFRQISNFVDHLIVIMRPLNIYIEFEPKLKIDIDSNEIINRNNAKKLIERKEFVVIDIE